MVAATVRMLALAALVFATAAPVPQEGKPCSLNEAWKCIPEIKDTWDYVTEFTPDQEAYWDYAVRAADWRHDDSVKFEECRKFVAVPGVVAFRNARMRHPTTPPHGGYVFFYWAELRVGDEPAMTYQTSGTDADGNHFDLTVFVFDYDIKPKHGGKRGDDGIFWRALQHEVSHYAGVEHPKNSDLEDCGKRRHDEEKEERDRDPRGGGRGGGGGGGGRGGNPIPPPPEPWDDWWCKTFGWGCEEEDEPPKPGVGNGELGEIEPCYSICGPKPKGESWPVCDHGEKCGDDDDGG